MIRSLQNLLVKLQSRCLAFSSRKALTASTLDEWKYASFSYSQLAEDLILQKLFRTISAPNPSWYVDVGAFHPVQYSNTLLLHRAGWRGINVDANPDAIKAFKSARPHDINIISAVSNEQGTVEFQIYQNPATNRIGSSDTKSLLSATPIRSIKVPSRSLASIVSENLPVTEFWGVLSVDCEGHDLAVLQSLDWNSRKPFAIVVEDYDCTMASEICEFCKSQGYFLYGFFDVARVFVETRLFNSLKSDSALSHRETCESLS